MESEMEWGKPTLKKPYEFFKGPKGVTSLGAFLKDNVDQSLWLIPFGAVYVNSKRVMDESFLVSEADTIRVHTMPKRYPLDRGHLKDCIVEETENFVVVNKPSGLPMHATLDNFHENLISGFDRPLYITHRLDVPTSGLVLLAKTKEYQTAFNHLLFERRVKKIYGAKVSGFLKKGIYTHYMQKTVTAPKILVKEKPQDLSLWQECKLLVVDGEGGFYKIELLTGRTH
jgi:23S rRNA pseudouridine1911/1915/1917 synthase